MGDGLARIVLVGEAAGEDHVRRDPVALGEAIDILVRFGGMHIVDAQVERRADLEVRQHADRGNTAGGVHQGGDRTAVDDPAFRVADDRLAVGQAQGQSFLVGGLDRQPQHLAMTQGREKAPGALEERIFRHDGDLAGSFLEGESYPAAKAPAAGVLDITIEIVEVCGTSRQRKCSKGYNEESRTWRLNDEKDRNSCPAARCQPWPGRLRQERGRQGSGPGSSGYRDPAERSGYSPCRAQRPGAVERHSGNPADSGTDSGATATEPAISSR